MEPASPEMKQLSLLKHHQPSMQFINVQQIKELTDNIDRK